MNYKKTGLAIAAAMAMAANANAEMYLGAAFGITSTDGSGFDDSNGLRVTGGYKFNKNFAVQVSYVDLGEFDAEQSTLNAMNDELSAEFGGFGSVTMNSASIEVSGLDFSLVAFLPFNEQFTGYARVGSYAWDVDVNVDLAFEGENFSGSESDDGSDLSYGLGVEYKFAEQWSVVGEWSSYEAADEDVSYTGVGVNFSF